MPFSNTSGIDLTIFRAYSLACCSFNPWFLLASLGASKYVLARNLYYPKLNQYPLNLLYKKLPLQNLF
ncbi:hypothetical protein HPNQ4044_0724 [Helicobacter pylori NQ4044]|uniref:Uncharacterized protein n=1 Tax=Helicobacter pylori NQ4044 TaxID=992028 RepID=J0JEA0_HELPX|nr:hypothetical protein HPNQ4044_0724 [Helicobacter pylori NQ4044]